MGDRWGTKVREPNGNIRMQMNRGRGYKVLLYLLMKAKRTAVTNTENVAFHAIRKAA